MIIKHTDGVEVDTEKLPDIDALILERAEELRKLCESANRIFLLQIDTRGNQRLTSFWNLKSGPDIHDAMASESFSKIAKGIHNYFMNSTNGNLGLYPTHAVDSSKLENNNNEKEM